MKPHLPQPIFWTAIIFAISLAPLQGQDNDSKTNEELQADIDRLELEAQLLTKEKALLSAQQELLTQQLTNESQRSSQWITAMGTLKDAASDMPSGEMTAATGLVATPQNTAIALQQAETFATTIHGEISPCVGQNEVVFTDTLPTEESTLEYQAWIRAALDALNVDSIDSLDITKKNNQIYQESDLPKAFGLLPTDLATAIVALPGAINTLAGFFRTDVSETTGTSPVTGDIITALVRSKLADGFYPDANSYAWSKFEGLKSTKVHQCLVQIEINRRAADAENKKAVAAKTTATANLAAFDAKAARLRTSISQAEEAIEKAEVDRIKAKPEDRDTFTALIDYYTTNRDALQAELDAATPAGARTLLVSEVTAKSTAANKAAAELAVLTKFINEAIGTGDKVMPQIVKLLKQEIVYNAFFAEPDPAVRFMTLAVTLNPQSTIERKSFLSKSYYSSALLGVEYTFSKANGRVVKSGFKWGGERVKIEKVKGSTVFKPKAAN